MAALVGCLLMLLPALPAAAEAAPRVTVNLKGADLTEALFYVFLGTGLRFEAPPGTQESITASLEAMPLDKVLRVLLEPRGYTFQREGDLYRITRKEGYELPGEKLKREAEARARRQEAERARRPRRVEPPSVRFLNAPGLVSVTTRPAGGLPLSLPYPLPGSSGPLLSAPLRSRPTTLGPLTVELPAGLRLFPGGGWEWSIPTEGEVVIHDGLGRRVIPFTGSGGLTIRRR